MGKFCFLISTQIFVIRNMNEALCSILCGEEEWRYCDQVMRLIKFNKDGTGEVCNHKSCTSMSLFLG